MGLRSICAHMQEMKSSNRMSVGNQSEIQETMPPETTVLKGIEKESCICGGAGGGSGSVKKKVRKS